MFVEISHFVLLQEKPTRIQMQEIVKIRKEIEIFRFKTKLLLHEKDRKNANIRQLKQTYTKLSDNNEETGMCMTLGLLN